MAHTSKRSRGLRRSGGDLLNLRILQKFVTPDACTIEKAIDAPKMPRIQLQPMSDLDLMIANGWGDVPQIKLPSDWRTTQNPNKYTGGRPKVGTRYVPVMEREQERR